MDTNLYFAGALIIPGELTGQLPRRMRLSQKGSGMAILVTVFLALAVFFALWGGMHSVQQMQHRAALRRDSNEATGEITDLVLIGRSADINVSYSFSVDGENFTGKATVPSQLKSGLVMFHSIPIRYLPADPTVNHPAGWEWTALLELNWIGASIIFVVAAIVLLLLLRMDRPLLAKGAPAVANVTQCSPNTMGNGFQVEYEFHAEDGRVTKGCGWYGSSQESGARICVLYLPQKPQRNLPYPSANYRVVQ